jgi:hypothetical protein
LPHAILSANWFSKAKFLDVIEKTGNDREIGTDIHQLLRIGMLGYEWIAEVYTQAVDNASRTEEIGVQAVDVTRFSIVSPYPYGRQTGASKTSLTNKISARLGLAAFRGKGRY